MNSIRKFSIKFSFTIIVISYLVFYNYSYVFGGIYEVGPGKKYTRISEVPFDYLGPGDVVKIYHRERPYHEKFILRKSGTKKNPIVITGIPENGKFPVIDGRKAIQSQKEQWQHAGRWLIKVGDREVANYVQVKGLELRNANNSQTFMRLGKEQAYGDNAAGVFVSKGHDILISLCIIHSCGNGVQTSYAPDVDRVTISGCYIYDNGNHKDLDSSQEHNVYMCGTNTTIQFSRFGETHSDGQNVKDRGRDTVIRYNWVEGGKNRQLDLVDYPKYGRSNVYVYGNVLVQGREINNNNMIHWGGDTGWHRIGTLYLFNNTLIGKAKKTSYVVVRYPECSVEMINNVFVGSGNLWNKKGVLKGSNNWFSVKVNTSFNLPLGFKGIHPQFFKMGGIPYFPASNSMLVNRGTNKLPRKVEYMPKPSTGGIRRPTDGRIDIGAYEFFSFK